MFTNVLIAEDHESANISIQKTLTDMGVNYTQAYYCDHALTRISKSVKDGYPYDLLITDLSFEDDGSDQRIKTGEDLIKSVKSIQPAIKVLVFSAEDRASVIETLFQHLNIDGYVRKARHDAQELKQALKIISENRKHFPASLRQAIRQNNAYDFSSYDTTIVGQLAKGMLQKDIPSYLQAHHINPSGLSSIEKRLNLIRASLNFSNNEQLIAYCKDRGII